MNEDIKKYLKDCKKVFPFMGKKEKDFFIKFQENINDHVKTNDNKSYQELVKQIGSPKDIMISYIQDCDNEYIIQKMNLKKLMKQIFITISVVLIVPYH